jgi:hypothetical protein
MTYQERKMHMKMDLLKGLISVDGNITISMTGLNPNKKEITFTGTYWGGNSPKRVEYIVVKDYFEMLEDANTVEDVMNVYNAIGYFVEPN